MGEAERKSWNGFHLHFLPAISLNTFLWAVFVRGRVGRCSQKIIVLVCGYVLKLFPLLSILAMWNCGLPYVYWLSLEGWQPCLPLFPTHHCHLNSHVCSSGSRSELFSRFHTHGNIILFKSNMYNILDLFYSLTFITMLFINQQINHKVEPTILQIEMHTFSSIQWWFIKEVFNFLSIKAKCSTICWTKNC